VVAKAGLDGHDRGAKVIARALRDAGGLSILSGAHMTLFPRVREELVARGLDDVLLFGGGIIPDADIAVLKGQGVAEIFTPGATMVSITDWLAVALDGRETAA
jgi:methylmalonyl-CoA mutase C-terminal domain/subunit